MMSKDELGIMVKISEQVTKIEDHIATLFDVIRPILVVGEEQIAKESVASVKSSPLVSLVNAQTKRLKEISENLEYMLRRIEL